VKRLKHEVREHEVRERPRKPFERPGMFLPPFFETSTLVDGQILWHRRSLGSLSGLACSYAQGYYTCSWGLCL